MEAWSFTELTMLDLRMLKQHDTLSVNALDEDYSILIAGWLRTLFYNTKKDAGGVSFWLPSKWCT